MKKAVDICDEFRRFLAEDLNDCHPTIKDLRGAHKNFLLKKLCFLKNYLYFCTHQWLVFVKRTRYKVSQFIDNLLGILDNTYQLHHSHITGEIIGFADSYCNQKIRENYFKIPVVPHNLFRFDFFFLLNGLRSGVWRIIDIKIGGKNPTNINFASIGNQVEFIYTIKYFQQSLSALANSLTDKEKSAISREREIFLRTDSKIFEEFLLCTEEEKQWVL